MQNRVDLAAQMDIVKGAIHVCLVIVVLVMLMLTQGVLAARVTTTTIAKVAMLQTMMHAMLISQGVQAVPAGIQTMEIAVFLNNQFLTNN
jgi:hypothetical protein